MERIQIDIQRNPYQMAKEQKDAYLTEMLKKMTSYHQAHCQDYGNMLKGIDYKEDKAASYENLPFLPVGLFKRMTLSSLAENECYKVATSSGTTNQARANVILDGETRQIQQQALAVIGNDFFGSKRLPMLIIDSPQSLNRENRFSARTAGILGFSLFASRQHFALNQDMTLNIGEINRFMMLYGKQPFFIFGFTFLVWQYFYQAFGKNTRFDFSQGILIHGGGWKKLENQKVSREQFKAAMYEKFGISKVHDYYGMAEQTGSIFMECEYGHLHCSDFSGILIRRPENFSIAGIGEKGLVQTMSVLPWSYPGHNLLTEDEGMLLGIDDCPCHRKGAYFQVLGRIKKAEIRGCSDVYGN